MRHASAHADGRVASDGETILTFFSFPFPLSSFPCPLSGWMVGMDGSVAGRCKESRTLYPLSSDLRAQGLLVTPFTPCSQYTNSTLDHAHCTNGTNWTVLPRISRGEKCRAFLQRALGLLQVPLIYTPHGGVAWRSGWQTGTLNVSNPLRELIERQGQKIPGELRAVPDDDTSIPSSHKDERQLTTASVATVTRTLNRRTRDTIENLLH